MCATPLTDDERFMRRALDCAAEAAARGEVPVGAVVVCDGQIIAEAGNRRETDADPAAHAEFLAIEAASRRLGRWRLSDCTVYVTLEPCLMCAGLMHQARIARCVYGAPDPKAGALGTLYDLHSDTRLNHNFAVTSGVLGDQSAALLQSFFRRRRKDQSEAPSGADSPGSAGKPDTIDITDATNIADTEDATDSLDTIDKTNKTDETKE